MAEDKLKSVIKSAIIAYGIDHFKKTSLFLSNERKNEKTT